MKVKKPKLLKKLTTKLGGKKGREGEEKDEEEDSGSPDLRANSETRSSKLGGSSFGRRTAAGVDGTPSVPQQTSDKAMGHWDSEEAHRRVSSEFEPTRASKLSAYDEAMQMALDSSSDSDDSSSQRGPHTFDLLSTMRIKSLCQVNDSPTDVPKLAPPLLAPPGTPLLQTRSSLGAISTGSGWRSTPEPEEASFQLKSRGSGLLRTAPHRSSSPSPSSGHPTGLHSRGATVACGENSRLAAWPGPLTLPTPKAPEQIPPPFLPKASSSACPSRGQTAFEHGPWVSLPGSHTLDLATQSLASQEEDEHTYGPQRHRSVFSSESFCSQSPEVHVSGASQLTSAPQPSGEEGFAVEWPDVRGMQPGAATAGSVETQEADTPLGPSTAGAQQQGPFQARELQETGSGFEDDAPPWEVEASERQGGGTPPPTLLKPFSDAVADEFGDGAPPWESLAANRVKSLPVDNASRAELEDATVAAAIVASMSKVQGEDTVATGRDAKQAAGRSVHHVKSWDNARFGGCPSKIPPGKESGTLPVAGGGMAAKLAAHPLVRKMQTCIDELESDKEGSEVASVGLGFEDSAPPWESIALPAPTSTDVEKITKVPLTAQCTISREGEQVASQWAGNVKPGDNTEITSGPTGIPSGKESGALPDAVGGLAANLAAHPLVRKLQTCIDELESNKESSEVTSSGLEFEDSAPIWESVALPAATSADVGTIAKDTLMEQSGKGTDACLRFEDDTPPWASIDLPPVASGAVGKITAVSLTPKTSGRPDDECGLEEDPPLWDSVDLRAVSSRRLGMIMKLPMPAQPAKSPDGVCGFDDGTPQWESVDLPAATSVAVGLITNASLSEPSCKGDTGEFAFENDRPSWESVDLPAVVSAAVGKISEPASAMKTSQDAQPPAGWLPMDQTFSSDTQDLRVWDDAVVLTTGGEQSPNSSGWVDGTGRGAGKLMGRGLSIGSMERAFVKEAGSVVDRVKESRFTVVKTSSGRGLGAESPVSQQSLDHVGNHRTSLRSFDADRVTDLESSVAGSLRQTLQNLGPSGVDEDERYTEDRLRADVSTSDEDVYGIEGTSFKDGDSFLRSQEWPGTLASMASISSSERRSSRFEEIGGSKPKKGKRFVEIAKSSKAGGDSDSNSTSDRTAVRPSGRKRFVEVYNSSAVVRGVESIASMDQAEAEAIIGKMFMGKPGSLLGRRRGGSGKGRRDPVIVAPDADLEELVWTPPSPAVHIGVASEEDGSDKGGFDVALPAVQSSHGISTDEGAGDIRRRGNDCTGKTEPSVVPVSPFANADWRTSAEDPESPPTSGEWNQSETESTPVASSLRSFASPTCRQSPKGTVASATNREAKGEAKQNYPGAEARGASMASEDDHPSDAAAALSPTCAPRGIANALLLAQEVAPPPAGSQVLSHSDIASAVSVAKAEAIPKAPNAISGGPGSERERKVAAFEEAQVPRTPKATGSPRSDQESEDRQRQLESGSALNSREADDFGLRQLASSTSSAASSPARPARAGAEIAGIESAASSLESPQRRAAREETHPALRPFFNPDQDLPLGAIDPMDPPNQDAVSGVPWPDATQSSSPRWGRGLSISGASACRTGASFDLPSEVQTGDSGSEIGRAFVEKWFGPDGDCADLWSPTGGDSADALDWERASGGGTSSRAPSAASEDRGTTMLTARRLDDLLRGAEGESPPENLGWQASGPDGGMAGSAGDGAAGGGWEALRELGLASSSSFWAGVEAVDHFEEDVWREDVDLEVDDAMKRLGDPSGEGGIGAALLAAGSPLVAVAEAVSARFAGGRLKKFAVLGRVSLKLSRPPRRPAGPRGLDPDFWDGLDRFRVVVGVECGRADVELGRLCAESGKLGFCESGGGARRKQRGQGRSREGGWEGEWRRLECGLGEAAREAVAAGSRALEVELLRYTVQPQALAGAPLHIQLHWHRQREANQWLLVDVELAANPKLIVGLRGVIATLRGLPCLMLRPDGQPWGEAQPRADWNREDNAVQWRIARIQPDHPPQHLQLSVAEMQDERLPGSSQKPAEDDKPPHLCVEVQFVVPHSTLSQTIVEGRVETRHSDGLAAKNLLRKETCLSDDYRADFKC